MRPKKIYPLYTEMVKYGTIRFAVSNKKKSGKL